MTSEEFLAEFIDTCIKNNCASPAAMCQFAQKEIDEIEDKIKVIEGLRARQSNLRQIIKQWSVTDGTKKAKKAPMITDFSKDDVDPHLQQICVKICDFIELRSPDKLTPYQIRDAVVSLEDHKTGYAAIKSLWDRGIIQRYDQGKIALISKGSKWNERPISTDKV